MRANRSVMLLMLALVASVAVATDMDSLGLRSNAWTNSTLGSPSNGTVRYCSDCTQTNPCAGSGSGATARRENGAWNCGGAGTQPTAIPLVFGTPGVIAIFATTPTAQLGQYAGNTCPTPQVATGIDKFGVLACTGIPTATPTDTPTTGPTSTPTSTPTVTPTPTAAAVLSAVYWMPAAACQNATAGGLWDLPTTTATPGPAAAACITGTNTQKGTLDFAASSNLSAQLTLKLPTNFNSGGTTSAKIKWLSATTSGNVVWQLATSCVADAETDDPSFNAADSVTDATKGTANQTNDASISPVTMTGCAADELLHIQIQRNAGSGSDTMSGTARLIGVELTVPRQ